MKYKSGDILYYVNPFVFIIEKVRIDMAVKEESGLYYIDGSGAYLREEDLFFDFTKAQRYALELLQKFCYECRYQILNNKPHYGTE